MSRTRKTVAAVASAAVVGAGLWLGTGGAAQAATWVTSADIVNRTILARDIRMDVIGHGRLTDSVRAELAKQGDISGYKVFSTVQDFGPGGIGGAWCGAPDANTEDQGWAVIGGGAKLSAADVDAGVQVASSWPKLDDPKNPGWAVQLNKPAGVDPGEVTVYAVCVKAPTD